MSELAELNWTTTGAASTVTVSVRPPMTSVRSTVTSPRWATRTFFCSAFLKPSSSPVMVYMPGSTKSNRYRPLSSDTRAFETPVASLISVTVTPGITPLLSSVTEPCTRAR